MIYTISDLHLDYTKKKDMKLFGLTWEDYEEKIFSNWLNVIKDDDLVLIPGDISWAMNLSDAYFDLKRIDDLPGIKILSKGNHDYWWQSMRKNTSQGYKTIYFLHNNSYIYKNTRIIGTRGWESPDSDNFKEKDVSIWNREIQRLRLSYNSKSDILYKSNINTSIDRLITMIHYPPFKKDGDLNELGQNILNLNSEVCVYGHLHGQGHKKIIEGNINGTIFICSSCDYINFFPINLDKLCK